MNIQSSEFVRGVVGSTDFLADERPQVAFVGRSNVGKSSVINSLLQRKGLVHTSSTPGKTLQINFFLINKIIHFVDLPGYGYAKHSIKRRVKLRKMITWYLTSGEANIAALVLIIDAKIGIKKFDREVLDIACEHDLRMIVIANKMDKLNQKERAAQQKEITADISLHNIDVDLIFYSAKTGKGREDALDAIEQNISL